MRTAACLLCVLLVAGCGTLTGIDSHYPSQWHVVTDTPKTCVSFEGMYDNKGATKYPHNGGPRYLSIRFGLEFDSHEELEAVSSVRLSCRTDDTLLVEALSNGSVVQSREIMRSPGTWDIEGARMIFPTENRSSAEVVGGVAKYVSFSLHIATNGALIGEEASRVGSLAFWVIPVGGKQTFWFNWARR